MAERRMFAKSIVMSDAFLDMPMSARCLYFMLGMVADDDGFVGSPKTTMRMCGASQEDLDILLAKRYVLGFSSGVIVVKHWKINNYLRNDRHSNTTYVEEMSTLTTDEKGSYTEKNKASETKKQPKVNPKTEVGIPNGNQLVDERYTQYRIGKDSIEANSSSPLQEVSNKNKRNINSTGTTPIGCPEPPKELMLEADNPIEKPVFITIISRNGKEVPIYQDMVDMWKDAYRAVDVEGQLREMKAWSISNEAERKTEKGMIRFINNWLSREQDKAGRPNGKNERNDFYGGKYIKGTDIKMDLVAKGADRSRYTNQPALEDLL